MILGIGVNLNYPVALMPEVIRERATSILTITKDTIERDVFTEIDSGPRQVLWRTRGVGFDSPRRWEALFGLRGKGVRVEMTDAS